MPAIGEDNGFAVVQVSESGGPDQGPGMGPTGRDNLERLQKGWPGLADGQEVREDRGGI